MKIHAYSMQQVQYNSPKRAANSNAAIQCNWKELYGQLLTQWEKLTEEELDKTGPNCAGLAKLIGRKYQIPQESAESYLQNFQRTLPLFGS